MRSDLLSFLEVAYDLEAPASVWRANLVAVARRVFAGSSGAYAYLYQVREGQPVLTSPIEGDTCFLEAVEQGHGEADAELAARLYTAPSHAGPTSAWLQDPKTRKGPAWLTEMWSRYDVDDVLGILATRPSGDCLALGLGLTGAGYPDIQGRDGRVASRQGTLLARHLETAMNVRQAFAHEDAVVADLDEAGRGDVRPGAAILPSEVLDLARRMEHARSRVHAGDVEGLAVWNGLLEGRWSIIRHDRGGGRLRFLVIENPEQDCLRVLSPIERDVIVRVATGQANKVLAIDLDLHPSSVAKILTRALRKLGIGNRVQLALLARVLGRRVPQSQDEVDAWSSFPSAKRRSAAGRRPSTRTPPST
jgi:DNA-binding CsgD family transcriptional regulator